MGFPSPAADYVEDRFCLNKAFVHHPAATSLVDFGGLTYVIDAALTPRDGEVIEGEALSEVIVMGKVILTITQHYDWGRPTI